MMSLLRSAPMVFMLVFATACGPGGGIVGDPVFTDDDDDAVVDDDDDDAVAGPYPDIRINELTSTDSDFIELINMEDTEQDISGFRLRDDDPDHRQYRIPNGTTIPANGFLYFVKDVTDIGLGGEDAAVLFDPSGEVIDEIPYPDGAAGFTWCRWPDGTGDWTVCTAPTPGGPNVFEQPTGSTDPIYIAGLDRFLDPDVVIAEPNELDIDANGRLWAGDQENVRVQIFETDGSFLTSVGGAGQGPGQFTWANASNRGPESMKDYGGRMYVVDRIGRRVNVYDINTFEAYPSIGGDIGLIDPTGMAVSSSGLLYIGDQSANTIEVITTTGEFRATFQTHVGGTRILNKIETIAIDESTDRLFATSENDHRVEVFRLSTGEYLQQHVTERQSGGGVEPGRITVSLEGIITDPFNRLLFVCDEEAGRYMLHDLDSDDLTNPNADFAFLGAFGSVGSLPGQFLSPDGVTVSAQHDRIAIADQANDRVQVFSLSELLIALGIN